MNTDTIVLRKGSHIYYEDGACIMELAAHVSGEPHSDHPRCVSPVIGAFMRSWNDSLPDDAARTRLLLPLLPKILDTASSADVELKRSYMAIDWLVRTNAPTWLELAGLTEHAKTLRKLPEIVDEASAEASLAPSRVARGAARKAGAAWRARGGTAATEAGTWTGTAGGAAATEAGTATGTVGRTAGEAAWKAAWKAAGKAAGDAENLAPTVCALQASAQDLVLRMAVFA